MSETKIETKSGGRCPYCEGTGQVMLLITQKPCRDCGGTGRVQPRDATVINGAASSGSVTFTAGEVDITTGGTKVAVVRAGDQKGGKMVVDICSGDMKGDGGGNHPSFLQVSGAHLRAVAQNARKLEEAFKKVLERMRG